MSLDVYNAERDKYLAHFHTSNYNPRTGRQEEVRTTPLCSLWVKHNAEKEFSEDGGKPVMPQYGLLGFNIGEAEYIDDREPILMNVAAPNSAFICGSQGSGKSYTLSVMLESCLLPDHTTGHLQSPITGVVFHYDADSSGSIAEAANLCSRGVKTRVLLSESNFYTLGQKYMNLQGADEHLTIEQLKLRSRDLTIERMLKLMAFSDQAGTVPLYMVVLQRILRSMASEARGAAFDYRDFKRRLETENFTREQSGPLYLRLDLLESFMEAPKKKSASKNLFNLSPGTLTIIDLSDPFVDASTACVLFDICLSLAKANTLQLKTGLVVALDEAHKFMNKSDAAETFTDRLLTTIREQRHNATRVIIATQEPTISEKLLDLCSVSIVHYFKSPQWFQAIREHLGGASSLVASHEKQNEMFKEILGLQTGESLVFSPSSFLYFQEGKVGKLGSKVMKMKTRRREGADGGVSILAGDAGHGDGMEDDYNAAVMAKMDV